MSKQKIKTTRAAKLAGLLSGLGTWALISLVSILIGVFFAQVLGIGILENDIGLIVFMGFLFLLGPVLAIFVGRSINYRWESYTTSKKYLLNIISLLLLLALPFLFFVKLHHDNNGLKTRWYDNGKKKYEGNFKDGEPDGLSVWWYENGQKKMEGNYKDGKEDGLWVSWYEIGNKKRETNYKLGIKNGKSVWWLENGQKKMEGNYKNDQKDGLVLTWHENGNKKQEENFINDKLINFIKWNEDEKKIKEGRWIEDLKLFLDTEWYENGMKKIESEWDGENTLTVRYYNNKGENIRTIWDTKAKSRVKAE